MWDTDLDAIKESLNQIRPADAICVVFCRAIFSRQLTFLPFTALIHKKLQTTFVFFKHSLIFRTEQSFSDMKPCYYSSNAPQIPLVFTVYGEGEHISVSHLVWTRFIVWPSSDNIELAAAAGHSWRTDCFFHWSHFCPAVWEGVVALHTAQTALPVVATHSVDLRTETQENAEYHNDISYVQQQLSCMEQLSYQTKLLHEIIK